MQIREPSTAQAMTPSEAIEEGLRQQRDACEPDFARPNSQDLRSQFAFSLNDYAAVGATLALGFLPSILMLLSLAIDPATPRYRVESFVDFMKITGQTTLSHYIQALAILTTYTLLVSFAVALVVSFFWKLAAQFAFDNTAPAWSTSLTGAWIGLGLGALVLTYCGADPIFWLLLVLAMVLGLAGAGLMVRAAGRRSWTRESPSRSASKSMPDA